MATVLYEPAFTVLAKQFPEPAERRRAMTAMTLVAALASFIFLPLSQALIDAHGWRDALVVLAVILAPSRSRCTRSSCARPRRRPARRSGGSAGSSRRRRCCVRADFWLLSTAFFLAQIAAVAVMVHAIPFLLERGHERLASPPSRVGLVGISQIPGRILFGPVAARVSARRGDRAVFALIAAGIVVVATVSSAAAIVAGFVLLGMGNGMATLARATVIADRYGQAAYGTIGGVAASLTIGARAVAPVAAAVYATALGYDALLWTLAALALVATVSGYRAELTQPRAP